MKSFKVASDSELEELQLISSTAPVRLPCIACALLIPPTHSPPTPSPLAACPPYRQAIMKNFKVASESEGEAPQSFVAYMVPNKKEVSIACCGWWT